MREKEVMKCPKCGGEMAEGTIATHYVGFRIRKSGDWFGDGVIPFYCKECGYIELYKARYEE